MLLSETTIDNAVHAALIELRKAGVSLNNDEACSLNDAITQFINDETLGEVKESVSFDELSGEQWLCWMQLAREAQSERGDDCESISSEDTEREAEALFAMHNGHHDFFLTIEN